MRSLLPPRDPARSLRDYRKLWLPEALALAALAAGAAVVFSGSSVDLWAVRRFYHPGMPDPWPLAQLPFWHAWYVSTPWITASLGAFGFVLLVTGLICRGRGHLRTHGVFILLTIIIGPGLMVNAGLKDHWGRPRPREVHELGGSARYSPALVPSRAGGKSFACGHCSVGFLYALGWWIWRRRSNAAALASLALGLVVGGLFVVDRMVAGGHFLSDGVWAALIAYGVAHVMYFHLLQVPLREPRETTERAAAATRPLAIIAVGVTGLGFVAAILFSWRYVDLAAVIPVPTGAPGRLEIVADRLDLEIHLTNDAIPEIQCTGDIHGFRLWPDSISAQWTAVSEPGASAHVHYLVRERRCYLYLDATARVRLPWRSFASIDARTTRGNLTVLDETGGSMPPDRRPSITLHSARGRTDNRSP